LQDALFLLDGSLSIIGDVLDMLDQPLIPVLLLTLACQCCFAGRAVFAR
jgi:hypothetical protein